MSWKALILLLLFCTVVTIVCFSVVATVFLIKVVIEFVIIVV